MDQAAKERAVHVKPGREQRATLYVVATPIGNLADITLRALEVLRQVDVIAAEDTRVTSRLLAHYGIVSPLLALHEHNERNAARQVVQKLERGMSVALVSDAGTPAISDPGSLAVSMVRAAGYPVVPIPGANAAVCAVSAMGVAAPHFLFYGFLPAQKSARRRELAALSPLPYLLIFYEAPHRVVACAEDLKEILGSVRSITVARELTKAFESIHTCTTGELPQWLAADEHRVRGELVLLVEGAPRREDNDDRSVETLKALLGELPLNQAVRLAARISGGKRNDLYQQALELKGQKTVIKA